LAGTVLLILVIAVVAVVFGMQNTTPLTIKFSVLEFSGISSSDFGYFYAPWCHIGCSARHA